MLSEAPAGLLILLAIALRGLGWRRGATVSGLLALFVRELAAPFVLILVGWAALERRQGRDPRLEHRPGRLWCLFRVACV